MSRIGAFLTTFKVVQVVKVFPV